MKTEKLKDISQNNKFVELCGGIENVDKIIFDIINRKECSVARIQRLFSFGFARAARIIDLLVEYSYISYANEGNKRDININKEVYEQFVSNRIKAK